MATIQETIDRIMRDSNSDQLKEMLMVDIIESRQEAHLLLKYAHKQLNNDMAILFDICVRKPGLFFNVRITHDMVRKYNLDLERLYYDAVENTEIKYPATLRNVAEVMDGDVEPKEILDSTDIMPNGNIFVLTSERNYRGAEALFYKGMLERIGNIFMENYYVLPHSKEEVLIYPVSKDPDPRTIKNSLKFAQAAFGSIGEPLSDKLLMYDRGTGLLSEVITLNRGIKIEMER